MSHFVAVVIGDNPEAQLAPYHEFECTGRDDQYVQDVDITEEARKEFSTHKKTRLKLPDGTLTDFFDDNGNWKPEYSRDTETGREKAIPEGCEEVEGPAAEVMSFAEFVKDWYGVKAVRPGEAIDKTNTHKYGYMLLDADGNVTKVVDRTNPNSKWDYYTVGGRWMGYFKLKEGAGGALGRPGVFDNVADAGTADVLRKGDIDWEGMRRDAGAEAGARYDEVRKTAGDLEGFKPWSEFYAKVETGTLDIETARKEFHAQPQMQRLDANRDLHFFFDKLENYLVPRETFVAAAERRAGVPFAIVKDSKWYERGSMGWWGMVSNEEDMDTWVTKFWELIDGLPDDTIITVVDCHI